jgi:predicted phosphoribosyltransferase
MGFPPPNSDVPLPFANRHDAGRRLGAALAHRRGEADWLVLGLPRGGLAVAFEVAQALHAPLDVLVVRKLGHPGHEEYAMGAIAAGGVHLMNEDIGWPVDEDVIADTIRREEAELQRRERLYRGDRPAPAIEGSAVIVVDDGLATGATMRVAVAALRQRGAAKVVVAVPVGSRDACELLQREADEVICLAAPEYFRAVGIWYSHFDQASDDEVRELLAKAREQSDSSHEAPH